MDEAIPGGWTTRYLTPNKGDLEPASPPAQRFNEGKPQWRYLRDMGTALEKLIKVMEQGAIKYEPGNWLKGGKPDSEYMDAADRHMQAFHGGEFYDPDTGCAHLAHAAWNMLALLECNYRALDDLDDYFDQENFLLRWTP